ncbi:hypothetical protein EUX98_g5876 [Antrodiella citrinella]|uniref:Uncharacterized protein n=1 Tax=Antrodiella citrinella TaxID=2447956 RepID=A0A4S4MQI9_9APHY|nr:hypothetical protein EUX98_g5876 [Antrodiella citrinella]
MYAKSSSSWSLNRLTRVLSVSSVYVRLYWEKRTHVNASRSTRPVTPEQHTHSPSLPRHSPPPPPRGDPSHHDQEAHTPRTALSPREVQPSSPLTLSTEVLPVYDDDDEDESPLPPSSPPLPSPAHVIDDEIRVAQSISPTPPAVRSTSLLAILNPAPDYTPPSSSLGLITHHAPTPSERTPSPRVSVRLDRPTTPDRNAHLDADVQASSSPLSVLSTPIVGRAGEVDVGVSTPVFAPAVLDVPVVVVQEETETKGVDVEVEVEATMLSSPLSVVSALQNEDAEEEEDVSKREQPKKAGKQRADVESEDDAEVRTQKKPRKKASKKAGGTTVQTRKTKPKFNRSPRVVYSDLESGGDDDDEETRAAEPEVLPALKPEPEPTHEEEEGKKAQKPRGRKRKADLDSSSSSSVPQKRSKKARFLVPSLSESTTTSRKRKGPLPTTSQPSPPSSPSKHLTPTQLAAKRAGIEQRCPPGVDVSEMEGMIVEALGSARASSLAVESVWRAVRSARPGLEGMRARRAPKLQLDSEEKKQSVVGAVEEKSGETMQEEQEEEEGEVLEKREWLGLVQDVLEYGRVTSGVFGRVESSFKDEHAHALPPHYFYVSENDADADRAAIIRSIMPRPAKRSETKKYKQYYWKPLGKVSRWDSEDAM